LGFQVSESQADSVAALRKIDAYIIVKLISPLPVNVFTVTGVPWRNESLIGDFLRCASSQSRSLAGPALLTAVRSFPDKAVSQQLLPDHVELAAA
jgi:hypothetical protein